MLQVQCQVKSFFRTQKDFKPSLRETANHIIIHVGTNNVSDQNKSPESIAESIVNLTTDIKNQSHDNRPSNKGLVNYFDSIYYIIKQLNKSYVKTEEKCNESSNNEFKIMKKNNSLIK